MNTLTNCTEEYQIVKVYTMHDHVYFNRSTAEGFNDGKDCVDVRYVLVRPGDTLHEDTQLDNYPWGMSHEEAEDLAND